MLFNVTNMRAHSLKDCLKCPAWDKATKQCNGGINKYCFLYDEKTKTCIDGITKLPFTPKKEG